MTASLASRTAVHSLQAASAAYLRHIAAYGEKLLKPDTTDALGVGVSAFSCLIDFPMLHGKRFPAAAAAAASLFFCLKAASRD